MLIRDKSGDTRPSTLPVLDLYGCKGKGISVLPTGAYRCYCANPHGETLWLVGSTTDPCCSSRTHPQSPSPIGPKTGPRDNPYNVSNGSTHPTHGSRLQGSHADISLSLSTWYALSTAQRMALAKQIGPSALSLSLQRFCNVRLGGVVERIAHFLGLWSTKGHQVTSRTLSGGFTLRLSALTPLQLRKSCRLVFVSRDLGPGIDRGAFAVLVRAINAEGATVVTDNTPDLVTLRDTTPHQFGMAAISALQVLAENFERGGEGGVFAVALVRGLLRGLQVSVHQPGVTGVAVTGSKLHLSLIPWKQPSRFPLGGSLQDILRQQKLSHAPPMGAVLRVDQRYVKFPALDLEHLEPSVAVIAWIDTLIIGATELVNHCVPRTPDDGSRQLFWLEFGANYCTKLTHRLGFSNRGDECLWFWSMCMQVAQEPMDAPFFWLPVPTIGRLVFRGKTF